MPGRCNFRSVSAAGTRKINKVASVINGINTAINTDGDIPTRIVCGIIEGGATMASGYICNKWTGDVELTTKTSQVIANAGVGYVVGHVAEIAAVGTSAVAKPIVKNVDSVISNVRTPKQSNTRVITTVSGRKKVINKVKKPARRNTKFQRICMA